VLEAVVRCPSRGARVPFRRHACFDDPRSAGSPGGARRASSWPDAASACTRRRRRSGLCGWPAPVLYRKARSPFQVTIGSGHGFVTSDETRGTLPCSLRPALVLRARTPRLSPLEEAPPKAERWVRVQRIRLDRDGLLPSSEAYLPKRHMAALEAFAPWGRRAARQSVLAPARPLAIGSSACRSRVRAYLVGLGPLPTPSRFEDEGQCFYLEYAGGATGVFVGGAPVIARARNAELEVAGTEPRLKVVRRGGRRGRALSREPKSRRRSVNPSIGPIRAREWSRPGSNENASCFRSGVGLDGRATTARISVGRGGAG
jgi:hypothetical protein